MRLLLPPSVSIFAGNFSGGRPPTGVTHLLTHTKLKNLKPGPKMYRVPDSNGLSLEVPSSGSPRWRFRYRFGGKPNMLSLGVYPEVTLAMARERRDEARVCLAKGMDPSEKKKSGARGRGTPPAVDSLITFRALSELWVTRQRVAEVTARKTRWILDTYILPYIGENDAKAISSKDLLAVLRKLEEKDLLETAKRAKIKIGQIYRFAVLEGLAEHDPTSALRGVLKAPKVRHHPAITEPRKIGELLRAIDSFQGQFVTQCALKLAPLVFLRPGELRHAQWAEVDLDARVWRIPAARMKGDAPHLVPLSTHALAIFKLIKPYSGNERLVFPGVRSSARPLSENTLNAALRRLGFGTDEMTSHGFRGMAASRLNELGWNPDAVERQLAHTDGNKVREAYTHGALYLEERTRMMQAWGDYLEELRKGDERRG